MSRPVRPDLWKSTILELAKTDMQKALKRCRARTTYIAKDEGSLLPDCGKNFKRDRACARIIRDLRQADKFPIGFAEGFTQFYDPTGLKPDPVEGVTFAPPKGGRHPDTGEPLKVGNRVVPFLFNEVAACLHLLCEQNKTAAIDLVRKIDETKAFRPGETMRILCEHGMVDEARDHLRHICRTDREWALNTAHEAKCDAIPKEERLAIIAEIEELRNPKKTPTSYVDRPEAQGTTLGDVLMAQLKHPSTDSTSAGAI